MYGLQSDAVDVLLRSLLSGDSQSLSSSTGGLGSLTLDLEVPEVTETSVLTDLLHSLEILSESGINHVGINLAVSSVLDASLSVQEPLWNSVLYSNHKFISWVRKQKSTPNI